MKYDFAASVVIQRPNKLRATRSGGFADVEMVFDGDALTLAGKNVNLFTRIPVPGSIDNLMDVMHNEYDRPLPAADLLTSDAYNQLTGDITDVKDHAEQLQSLQQRLLDYVNVASDWFWESDVDHRITFLSDRFTATTGLDPDAIIGEEIRNIARRSEDAQDWSDHLEDLQAHAVEMMNDE